MSPRAASLSLCAALAHGLAAAGGVRAQQMGHSSVTTLKVEVWGTPSGCPVAGEVRGEDFWQ